VRALSQRRSGSGRVMDDRLLGHRGELLLEAPQVGGAVHLGPVRLAEDEVAEAEALQHHVAQLLEEEGRPLEEEVGPHTLGEGLVLRPGGVEDDRHVRVGGPHLAREVRPRAGDFSPARGTRRPR